MNKMPPSLIRSEKFQECDTTIGVGDMVLSYDFHTEAHCYYIGQVIEVGRVIEGCPRYTILCFSRTWSGQAVECHDEREIHPPLNGTPRGSGGFCNGVRRLV